MTDRPDPLIGTRLGDYTILGLIGRGGMARVYEGLDEKLGRPAAVKVIEVEHEKADELTQRFIREARAAANLDHPNIVSVYQFGEDGNLYYMAMKLIPGHTLLNLLKKRRQQKKYLEPDEIINIVSQIGSALDYAHSKGVIHRDIKPSNIMLTDDNKAILTDFGLTMQLGVDNSTLGTAFGTPRYISPEQAMASHRAVPQSDIYSLGVVLYEMATGQAPFDSDSPMSLALSHISNPPPEPKSVRPDLPHPVQMVILKALEKRPENRWQTAAEMVKALEAAYKGIEPNITLSQEKLDTPPIRRVSVGDDDGDGDTTALITAKQLSHEVSNKAPAAKGRSAVSRVFSCVIMLLLIAALAGGGFLLFKNISATPALAGLYPTPTALPTNTIRLTYSKDSFYINNISDQTFSLEGLTFQRSDKSGLPFKISSFPQSKWMNFGPKACLQIVPQGNASADLCKSTTNSWPYEDPTFIFWTLKSDADSADTFTVMQRGILLQTCSMRVNTCEFTMP